MGNKRNKVLRQICMKKRSRKTKTIASQYSEPQDNLNNNPSSSATSLALLTTVNLNFTNTDIGQVQNSAISANDEPVASPVEKDAGEDSFLKIQGRRIIDINYFIQQLQKISSHSSLFSCNFKDMSLIGENRNGLLCKYKFQCQMCKEVFIVTNEDTNSEHKMNANLAAVTGIISTGIGYSQFQEMSACIDLPVFSQNLYLKNQDAIYENWESVAVESMQKAALREREAAIAEGKLSRDGIPIIDVYADGVWSSRSYGKNYKALSLAAAIVGRKFKQVLFIGIKNKYCLVCARAEKKRTTTPEHKCFKNYTGPSSGMEGEIISQGFQTSVDMYNIIYGRLIADGDSATYSKILARNPYSKHDVTVQKIECRNHILRNFCNRLRAITKDTKYPLDFRKTLTDIKIMTMRKVVTSSINHFKQEKDQPQTIINFRNEVQNSISHAYGNHEKCKNYYCSKEKILQKNIELENTTFWFKLNSIIQTAVLSKSRSLLENVDTNPVECFNSVVAKIVGGKRINFSLRRGYHGRCHAAVVSYNNPFPKYSVHKKILGRSPTSMLKKFEERKMKQRLQANPHKKNRTLRNFTKNTHDYGPQSTCPDMTPQDYLAAKTQFLDNLKKLTADRDKIQQSTRNQRDSSDWLDIRKKMITASNFGIVAKRKETSSKAKLVQNILYQPNLAQIRPVAHGLENERFALQQLALQEKVTVEPCGLFVDQEYPFIGATPDGLIGNDMIVEIKCPLVAYKIGIDSAIKQNKIQIWRFDRKTNQIVLNKNSNWFYQVQGQLHVTGRKKCLFGVWSDENHPIKTEFIDRDDGFWETRIKTKIISFYMDWLLPEIIDSRQARGLPLRESDSSKDNTQCTKRSRSRTEYAEEEPYRKIKHILGLTTSSSPDENLPSCSRQLKFEEM